MKSKLRLVLLSPLFIVLYGCIGCIAMDPPKFGFTGIIIDKDTGKPISGATVSLSEGKMVLLTDSRGFCNGTCGVSHTPIVLVSKNGYKPFQIEFDKSRDLSIYKVKHETEYVNLEKPFYFVEGDSSTYMVNIAIEKWSVDFASGDTMKIYLSKSNKMVEIEKIKAKMLHDFNR